MGALLEQGFEFLAYLRHQDRPDAPVAFVALLAKDSEGQLAQVAFLRSNAPTATIRSAGVILETYYADGFILQSSTFAERRIFASRPNVTGISFNGFISQLAELYSMHRFLETQLGHGKTRPSGASADPAAFMVGVGDIVMRRQVEAGIYRLDAATSLYRPTVRGAYLMTWKMLWPWKQLVNASSQKKARYWVHKAQLVPLPINK